jgi:hypothetical protein
MILISHRGNLSGKNEELENSPEYIMNALNYGFNVEVDVWYTDERFYLGHDNPQFEIDPSFLEDERIWCHAKNLGALYEMLLNKKIHSFWHQSDDYTLTSNNIIWAYPKKELTKKSICVLPELFNYTKEELSFCFGICSDYIQEYL